MGFELILHVAIFACGFAIGVLAEDRNWRRAFDEYALAIRQIIKSHDCGQARRHGWTLGDEIETVEKPYRLH